MAEITVSVHGDKLKALDAECASRNAKGGEKQHSRESLVEEALEAMLNKKTARVMLTAATPPAAPDK